VAQSTFRAPETLPSAFHYLLGLAETTGQAGAVLIPLARTNHLPDFHWKSVSVAAPLKPPEPQPTLEPSTSSAVYSVSPRRIFIPRPSETLGNRITSTEFVSIDPPGAINLGGPPRAEGILLETFTTMPTVTGPSHPPIIAAAPAAPIRVGGGVQMAKLVKKVIPEYPPLAKTARVSGVVHLLGVIAKDGTIQNLQLIGGHPLLARAAIEAVRQWVYQPTLLNGQPVEVIAPIDVNFTLGQ
jgi:protein TonB